MPADQTNKRAGSKSAGRTGAASKSAKEGAGKKRQAMSPAAKRTSSKKTRKAQKKSGLGRLDDRLVYILSHPLRVRMLASLNEEDGSASDLAARLSCDVHHAAYHMRKLREYDYVELVDTVLVGTSIKKIYRAKQEVNFSKDIWERLPSAVQQLLIVSVFMTSYSDAEVALLHRSYQKRPESHASWSNLRLDEKGWGKLVKLLNRTLVDAGKIAVEAKARMDGEPPLTVSLNLSGFVLPDNADPVDERVNSDVKKRLKGKSSLRHRPGDVEA